MAIPPYKSFAIFGTMRSGSNLLERLINQYDGLHCFGELFNKGFIGRVGQQVFLGVSKETRDADPQRLLDAIHNDNPAKTTGFRLFAGHDERVIQKTLLDQTCAKIILRRDPVESFVSLQIAKKTDQWLIHDEADRKQAKIHFNIADFRRYRRRLEAYYQLVETSLRDTGQDNHTIHFRNLGSIDAINALAAFIGDSQVKDHLEQPIKRQNPGALRDKIINYTEVYEALDLPVPDPGQTPPPPAPALKKGSTRSRVFYTWSHPLAYIPVPSVPENQIRDWLDSHGGFGKLGQGDDLEEWQKKFPQPLVFTAVDHPVSRAYDAFMNKIFSVGGGSYSSIRNAMSKQFGLVLPKAGILETQNRDALANDGYGPIEHRQAFKQFLAFVRANHAGETDIRQDGKWAPQSGFIDNYRKDFPDLLVLNEPELGLGLIYIENRLAMDRHIPMPAIAKPDYLFSLAEIYDSETETLCQDAYVDDYLCFGFGPLSSL